MEFEGQKLRVAELFELIPPVSYGITEVYQFTNYDIPLTTPDGKVWTPAPIKRGQIGSDVDLGTDGVDVQISILDSTKRDEIVELLIGYGGFRDVTVNIYAIDPDISADPTLLFTGTSSGQVEYNAGVLQLSCSGIIGRLKLKFPRMIYTEYCQHELFDEYCGLLSSAYKESGTIKAGSGSVWIYADVFAESLHDLGYWEQGIIKFKDPPNTYKERIIILHQDRRVKLNKAITGGSIVYDTFDVWPGCDKRGETCATKWAVDNYANFFGFESVPRPEVLLG